MYSADTAATDDATTTAREGGQYPSLAITEQPFFRYHQQHFS